MAYGRESIGKVIFAACSRILNDFYQDMSASARSPWKFQRAICKIYEVQSFTRSRVFESSQPKAGNAVGMPPMSCFSAHGHRNDFDAYR